MCWWEPTTKEVALVGGPGDGRILEVQDINRPLTIPVVRSAIFAADDEPPMRSEVVTYRLSGWNTDSRRWLMSPAP